VPFDEPDCERLLYRGAPMTPTNIRLEKGDARECHRNSVRIWLKDGHGCSLMTGYALSSLEPKWYQHSWVLDGEGRIVETTALARLYYGMRMSQREAELIAMSYDPIRIRRSLAYDPQQRRLSGGRAGISLARRR
jgi:hypothetical protein